MNTISPYTIRCFNPLMKGKKVEDSYSPLGSIGQFDMYEVFKSYITGKGKTYHILKATEQIYSFSGFKFNDSTREIRGVVRAGSYGSRTDLVNIKTGNIDFKRWKKMLRF
ncbi:hypothetical protein GSU75_01551 [Pseudomonas savastanoi pv. phaseolicola]|uniref:hypothetical protein n=1 Tax=Pseudomonas savastanoi TaxID=29438 RepID=UPI00197E4647|nr:hypothetical protein [Pseudomonas savastanoi]MBN4174346.1 hypothetical protein [Pseudomonas savastanoi pv. phaseolicola]